jgi:signal peptidase I
MTRSRLRRRSPTRPTAASAVAVALVVGVVLTRAFLVAPVRIASDSMSPTLRRGDVVVVWRGERSPERDDLVTFASPEDGALTVKRIVGLEGDRVALADALLYVNDELVVEPRRRTDAIDGTYYGPVTVPAGHVLVMSDDRDRAVDSRHYGPVPVSAVTGRVLLRLWPPWGLGG